MDETNKVHRAPKKGAKALKKRDKKGKVGLWGFRFMVNRVIGFGVTGLRLGLILGD